MATQEELKQTALAVYYRYYVDTTWTLDELADILVGKAIGIHKAIDVRLAQEK